MALSKNSGRIRSQLAQGLWRWSRRRIAAASAILYALSSLYLVFADQQAVVVVCGRVWQTRVQPGLHWTWPWPIAQVEKVKVLETKSVTVGIEPPERVLERGAGQAKPQFLTGDQNIINIRLVAQYTVKDPVHYLFAARDITGLLARSVESSLSNVVTQRHVDDLLTTEKLAVQQQILRHAQSLLDRYGCGVHLSSINIESIAPPEEVLEAFREVASAREDRERIKREADSYANDLLPRARGEASRLTQEARSYSAQKISESQGDASRFVKIAAEYSRARDVTATRLYLETMEEVIPRMKKIIIDGNIDIDVIQKK